MSQERNVADYEVRVQGKLDSVTECILKTAGVAGKCRLLWQSNNNENNNNITNNIVIIIMIMRSR